MTKTPSQPAKKLSLKKDTLRTLNDTQVQQLDNAAGGLPIIVITIVVSITMWPGDAN
ncbi:MAG TPA: hypothetical protein VF815_31450 [Myxococcaceae bacterium]|jgi:hypothetical protein